MNCPNIATIRNEFTHSGIFYADDVFSSALLFILNPEMKIERGAKVPEHYEWIVLDIGVKRFDHHQSDRYARNSIPYAAFGLLWE